MSSLQLAVHGDVGATLRAALPLIEQKADRSFLHRMLRRHAAALEHVVSAYTDDFGQRVPIRPEYAAGILDEVAAEHLCVRSSDPALAPSRAALVRRREYGHESPVRR